MAPRERVFDPIPRDAAGLLDSEKGRTRTNLRGAFAGDFGILIMESITAGVREMAGGSREGAGRGRIDGVGRRRSGRSGRAVVAVVACAAIAVAFGAMPVQAHFQLILPSTDIVPAEGERTVSLSLVFTHPMERGPVMEMAPPVQFGVLTKGRKTDLRQALKTRPIDGKASYEASYALKAPGDYVFFVEPAPYWEPSEEKMIVHYAKVVVDFASGEGWDAMVGFPVEIEPLVRPYGLWTGNLFRGIVRQGGKAVPFAEVEVEWVNDGSVKPPADPFVTQVIKADGNGVFAYAMPRAGWWGFAALIEGEQPMKSPAGKEVPVEAGALMWVRTVDMKQAQ